MSVVLVFSATLGPNGVALGDDGAPIRFSGAFGSERDMLIMARDSGLDDLTVVAEPDELKVIFDRKGNPVNEDRWPDWGFTPSP
jgi:hypothetical protein